MKSILSYATIALCGIVLAGCAGAGHREWIKEGASPFDRTSARSECEYQIKLNKGPQTDQYDLLRLCMQGKGYRYERVM